MKKFLSAIVAACMLLALPAGAQQPVDPATLAAVKELLVSMHYRELMTSAMQQMVKNMPQMLLQTATNAINANTTLTEEQKKAELAKAAERIPGALAGVQAVFSDPTLIDELMTEAAPLYARHFTADEIHQLAAFYQTPLGTKMLATMPQIMNEAMQMSQKIIMPRVARQIEAASAAVK